MTTQAVIRRGLREVRINVRMTLEDRFLLRFVDAETVYDVEVIRTTARAWVRRPESRDPAWLARRFGPFVFAARLTV